MFLKFGCFLAACLAPVVSFSGAQAENSGTPAWSAALHGSSDRLLLYALAKNPPPDARPYIAGMMYSLGATQSERPVRFDWGVRPMVSWDGNFNNRTPGSSFDLAGYHFVVDQASRAVGGLVLGVQTTGQAQWRYRYASTVTLSGWASAEYLPKFGMNRQGFGTSLCVSDYQGNWLWLDACAQHRISNPALDETYAETRLTAGPTWLFGSDEAVHEMAPRLGLIIQDGESRPSVSLDWQAAVPEIGATRLQVETSKQIEGWHGVTFSARTGLARRILGKSTTVNLQYDKITGGLFFGEPRTDKAFTIGIERPFTNGGNAALGWRKVRSSASLYDDTGFTMTLSFRGRKL